MQRGKSFILSLNLISLSCIFNLVLMLAQRSSAFTVLKTVSRNFSGRSSIIKDKGVCDAVAIGVDVEDFATLIKPPKGTRDFYPADFSVRSWLHDRWRLTARKFGFVEYDAPVLESEQLYVRKAGEEITDQLYNFIDKGGRRVSLRPEMTPSLARMVLAKGNSVQLPLKWFSVPQCWRYERMSRGRRREHFQWNMDVWGIPGVEAEAELIAAAVTCMQSFGLTSRDVGIKVNSRKLLNEVMAQAGMSTALMGAACVIVDKADKLPADAIEQQLLAAGLSLESTAALLSKMKMRSLDDLESALGHASEGASELRQLLALLRDGYGIGEDWVRFDFGVVRGLSYYTGVVFEGADKAGKLRAICGGGRYDSLFQTMGGQRAIPAAGFGFGDAVIMELLEEKGLAPCIQNPAAEVMVFAWEEELRPRAMAVAAELRAAGLRVDLVLERGRKAKAVLQRADKGGVAVLVMLAPHEHAAGGAVVRQLAVGEQVTQPYENISAHVAALLQEKATC